MRDTLTYDDLKAMADLLRPLPEMAIIVSRRVPRDAVKMLRCEHAQPHVFIIGVNIWANIPRVAPASPIDAVVGIQVYYDRV